MNVWQALDLRNLFAIPRTILGNATHADWRGAAEQGGLIGLVGEALQTAVGTNTEPFFVPCGSEWKIDDIAALLRRHGIKLWGAACFNDELYFRVEKRQAHWAQYVMLRAGVPLLHGLLDGSRAIPGYGGQPNSGDRASGLGGLLDTIARELGL